jgi:photosystem II stability/assembly factor-like uncharacterized protein
MRQHIRCVALAAAALATVSLAAGCGTVRASAARATPATVRLTSSRAARAAHAPQARPGPAVLFNSLQMTSASTGWALISAPSGRLSLSRTTDGARLWTDVTPAAARPMLGTTFAQAVLDALSGSRAYLAVTAETSDSGPVVNVSEVFGTADGGRTWTESAPVQAPAGVHLLDFAGPSDGWLMIDSGGAMNHDPVRLYRTTDAGRRWSLAAAAAVPATCDKHDLTFASASDGWIADTCPIDLPDLLLVSHDGGVTWSPAPLPAVTCPGGCFPQGPQFTGRTGFFVIGAGGEPAATFLVTHDLGATWQQQPLPAGAGTYPRLTFFTADSGVLVSAGAQGAVGRVFFVTADGGATWTPVRQGHVFSAMSDAEFDFVSPDTGFAWIPAGFATSGTASLYLTTNSGRTWTALTPRAVRT